MEDNDVAAAARTFRVSMPRRSARTATCPRDSSPVTSRVDRSTDDERVDQLQHERRLTDARLPREEDDLARHETAAEDAVDLIGPGGETLGRR